MLLSGLSEVIPVKYLERSLQQIESSINVGCPYMLYHEGGMAVVLKYFVVFSFLT